MSSGPASAFLCRSSGSPHRVGPWLVCAALLAGCGAAWRGGPDEAFAAGVEASLDEDWSDAALATAAFLRDTNSEEERYDRAQLILAGAELELGLTYAAAQRYLDVAESGRDPELADDAIGGLERIVRGWPHDEAMLIEGYLATADIHGLPSALQAFVDYHQGLSSLQRSHHEWAKRKFSAIPETSSYAHRARFAVAVDALAAGRFDEGHALLEALLEEEDLNEEVAAEAPLALARLAMDEERYDDAVAHYETVTRLAPERPELLLEMAWAHYYKGDSRRALGLLIALDAPVHRSLIAPERYLLEAFCLRRLCQFEPARFSAYRLRRSHGQALDELHRGLAPFESTTLRVAARRRPGAFKGWRYLRQVMAERELAEELFGSSEFGEQLKELYDHGVNEARRRQEAVLEAETVALAEELLAAEDGVRLILHELSVQLLRGRFRPAGPDQVPPIDISAESRRVSFRFENEFWTDELDALVVVIEDRCLE